LSQMRRRLPPPLAAELFPARPRTVRTSTRSTSRRCSACSAEAERSRRPKASTRRVRCVCRRFRQAHALSIHGLCSLSRQVTTPRRAAQ
jgi:hypothetical protein